MNHIEFLKSLDACGDATRFAAQFPDLKTAWENCKRPDWMLWLLIGIDHNDDKTYRLFACWCIRNTKLQDGRTVWDLLADKRSRDAVEVAGRFAVGEATEVELAAARAAASDAAGDAAWAAARDAASAAARDAASAAAMAAASAAASAAAWAAARDAASAAARAAASAAASAAARAAQAIHLRDAIAWEDVEKSILLYQKSHMLEVNP